MVNHGTQSVDRAASLLSLVVTADEAPTFTALCAQTGFARSTTSRLLSALERADLLGRDARGAWVPGPLFDQYAARRGPDERLLDLAGPVMDVLGELTGETVHLAVASAGKVVQVAQVDSTYLLGTTNWVGVEVPAHCSSLGKVLYAYGALAVPQDPLERPTARSISAVAELTAVLPEIRACGWAMTVDELEVGLCGIGAPILVNGEAIAALGLSGPTSRMGDSLTATASLVSTHARTLSLRLSRVHKEGAA